MNEKMFILACSKCKSINVIKKKMIECQDCGYVGDIFESTFFYDVIEKWKNWFAKNADIQWHSMEDLNSYITAIIFFVNSIKHKWNGYKNE